MKRRHLSLAAAAAALLPPAGNAAEPFVNAGVVLLQLESRLQARVKDPVEFAAYMQRVEAATAQPLRTTFQRRPLGGFIVLALRPGRRSKVWLDLDGELPGPTGAAIVTAIEGLQAPDVQDGLVVLAIKASFWGGRPTPRAAPAPAEWKAAARAAGGAKLEVEALVDRVWAP